MTAALIRWVRSRLSSFFSTRIEDSFRLRALTLAGLWVAAIGLVWVGGDLRFCLAGGVLGTVGHWFSYKMRYRPSRLRPLVISVLVVGLSIYLRNDMVKTFNGDWVPIGQYLVLVSGLAAYDVRTRGGLYTGLVLSGMVLFFASQQAFDYSFGIFVIGFVVVLMAFLVLTYLEDMIRTARVYWAKNRVETMGYWVGSICVMFLLAGLAFWVLPRGENNLVGPPQLAVLPYSESDIDIRQSPQPAELETGLPADLVGDRPGEKTSGQEGGTQGDGPETGNTPRTSIETGETGGTGDQRGGASGNGPRATGEGGSGLAEFGDRQGSSQVEDAAPVYAPDDGAGASPATGQALAETSQLPRAAGQSRSADAEDPVVFHVRSKVASYWRALVMEDFDGSRWFVSNLNNQMIESPKIKGTWYNKENDFSHDNVNYSQTFFIRGKDQLPMITGYRALRVVVNDEQTDAALLGSGSSYQVISSVPRHTPDQLRNDTSRGLSPILALLPEDLEDDLKGLAQEVGTGASSDFEKMGRIISYLNIQTKLLPGESTGLASLATLDEFLFQGAGGSVLDYATATVMLARASGLPARLAVGYLPGVRDPLSGTYRVRQSDRHAWAEVLFDKNGWVPFDGAPRSDFFFGQRPSSGLGRLFLSGGGAGVYTTLKDGPLEALKALANSVPGPVLWTLGPAATVLFLIVRWFRTNSSRQSTGPGGQLLRYAPVTGKGKREMKKLYAQVERLIRRDSGARRARWQTAGHYASISSGRSPEIDDHLDWFTRAVWQAAYRSGDLSWELVTEGRRRLLLLKKAFKASGGQTAGSQG